MLNLFIGFSGLGCLARISLFCAIFLLGWNAAAASGITFAWAFVILMAALLAAANLAFVFFPRERPRSERLRGDG